MIRYYRNPREVIGTDPALVAYWNKMPVRSQLRLLDSSITVSTLGELKKLGEELSMDDTSVPPYGPQ